MEINDIPTLFEIVKTGPWPIPLSMDIRGWFEMHPLNSVGWSLFFEYIANILYALGMKRLSDKAMACFVASATFPIPCT